MSNGNEESKNEEIGIYEYDPEGELIRIDGTTGVSDFEKKLFEGGALPAPDTDKYIHEGENRMSLPHSTTEIMIQSGLPVSEEDRKWTEEDRKKRLEYLQKRIHYVHAWHSAFQGRIPARWSIGLHMERDLEEARNQGIHLSEDLIDAAISCWGIPTLQAAAKLHKLTPRQLGWALYSPWLRSSNKKFTEYTREQELKQVVESQMRLGLTDEELQQAKEIARNLEDIEKRGQDPLKVFSNPTTVLSPDNNSV